MKAKELNDNNCVGTSKMLLDKSKVWDQIQSSDYAANWKECNIQKKNNLGATVGHSYNQTVWGKRKKGNTQERKIVMDYDGGKKTAQYDMERDITI